MLTLLARRKYRPFFPIDGRPDNRYDRSSFEPTTHSRSIFNSPSLCSVNKNDFTASMS